MKIITLIISLLVLCAPQVQADTSLDTVLDQGEKLAISRNDYTLGKKLSPKQQQLVTRQKVPVTNFPGVSKFHDQNLFITIEEKSLRVISIYQEFKPVNHKAVQDLVGELFFQLNEPTTIAHDKTIYWAYNQKGKLSSDDFHRQHEKDGRLSILAKVKIDSSLPISGDEAGDSDNPYLYYFASLDQVFAILQQKTTSPPAK